MSKRKLMGCHNVAIDRWHDAFGGESILDFYFDQFYKLVDLRRTHAAEIRVVDVAYAAGEVTKSEYISRKKEHELTLKSIKPRMRDKFDKLFCQVLLMGNGCKCYICGGQLSVQEQFNRDHVFPKSMGFSIGGNMMPAHQPCNQSKDQRLPSLEEVARAVDAYEFAMMPFYPKGMNRRPVDIDPRYAEIIPPRRYSEFKYD